MKPNISRKASYFLSSSSPIREIMNYADPAHIEKCGVKLEDLISFAGGWVNHAAPEGLRNAYCNIANTPELFHQTGGYSPPIGMQSFKEAIVRFESHLYGMNGLQVDEIVVGVGATQLAFSLFDVLLDQGDRMLLLDPSYCNYQTQAYASTAGIELLRFPVIDADTWVYDTDSRIDDFRKIILEKKPKIVLIVSPDNPTSRVPSDKFVKAALDAVTEIGAFLIVDFAYKELVFGKTLPEYFSWVPADNFISLRSNSKWCRGLGRRLGWIEAPQFVVEALENAQNVHILAPDTMHQLAMTSYINSGVDSNLIKPYLNEVSALYKHASVVTVDAIQAKLSFPVIAPEGGLFACMKVGCDGSDFVNKVFRATGVLFVPGWGFGDTVKNAVRVSYGPLVHDLESIGVGLSRVANYLQQ